MVESLEHFIKVLIEPLLYCNLQNGRIPDVLELFVLCEEAAFEPQEGLSFVCDFIFWAVVEVENTSLPRNRIGKSIHRMKPLMLL